MNKASTIVTTPSPSASAHTVYGVHDPQRLHTADVPVLRLHHQLVAEAVPLGTRPGLRHDVGAAVASIRRPLRALGHAGWSRERRVARGDPVDVELVDVVPEQRGILHDEIVRGCPAGVGCRASWRAASRKCWHCRCRRSRAARAGRLEEDGPVALQALKRLRRNRGQLAHLALEDLWGHRRSDRHPKCVALGLRRPGQTAVPCNDRNEDSDGRTPSQRRPPACPGSRGPLRCAQRVSPPAGSFRSRHRCRMAVRPCRRPSACVARHRRKSQRAHRSSRQSPPASD